MSLTRDEAHCSSYHPFVVVLDFCKRISLCFDLERRNFTDVVYSQTATLHTNKVRNANSQVTMSNA